MNQVRQAGFTLIELIVVIVILGILAAVAIPQFTDTSAAARTSARQGLCSAISSQAVLLYATNRVPNSPSNILSSISSGVSGGSVQNLLATCNGFAVQASGDTGFTSCGITLPAGVCQ